MIKQNIGILGAGRMGSAIIRELLKNNSNYHEKLIATNHSVDNLLRYLKEYEIKKTLSNIEAIKLSDIIILGVRPQQMSELLSEIKDEIRPDQIVVSIAIGVPLRWLDIMIPDNNNIFHVHPPSTLMANSKGISFGCKLHDTSSITLNIVESLFLNFGKMQWIEESWIDKVAIMAGCSPAFLCFFLEQWKITAASYGLDPKMIDLVIEMMFEAIRYSTIENKLSYKDIIDNIATPNGVTEEGIKKLETINKSFHDVFEAGLKKIQLIEEFYTE